MVNPPSPCECDDCNDKRDTASSVDKLAGIMGGIEANLNSIRKEQAEQAKTLMVICGILILISWRK